MNPRAASKAVTTASESRGRYLIVDAHLIAQWPEVFVSPIGAVDNTGSATSEIRLINDYSIPNNQSVNDYTDRENFPSISYNPPRDIAKRIHHLTSSHFGECVLMMIGDISGAFRYIPIHADSVHMFSFVFEDLVVVDLSCGFGWCGSPAFYSLAGSIINALYEHGNKMTRQFTGNVWCDDHTCIEIDIGSTCLDANLSLRRAMATVLGPTAINEQKFTGWSTKCKALGLLWDTKTATVSVPAEKLAKAAFRVQNLLSDQVASRTTMLKVIGSLHHVVSCFPPARAFLQCLEETASGCPKYGNRSLSSSTIEDLRWFNAVLQNPGRFNGIPVLHFADVSEPQFHVFMDASGDGLCSLEPSLKFFIRQRFSQCELLSDSINVRELRSAVLAALHWGSYWSTTSQSSRTHVQFHIDNMSAVSWANRRASCNPIAKMYNRLLSLAEFQYNLIFTASHIAGKNIVMTDAGSRVWTADHPLADVWANMSSFWTQIHLEPPFDDLSDVWSQCSVKTPWRALPLPLTLDTGTSGADSPHKWVGHGGYQHQQPQRDWDISPLNAGPEGGTATDKKNLSLPTSPRLDLILQGIKRLSSPRRKKQPLTPPFLRLLHRHLDLSKPRQRLLWGSILIGYFFLLRRSEFLKIDKTRRFFCLKTNNAFYSDDSGRRVSRNLATSVTIGLEGAKNDQFGRGAWRTMSASGDKLLCPVKGLRHILRARKLLRVEESRHLCTSVTTHEVVKVIKTTARRIGVPASSYSSHSIRIGGATALAAGEFTVKTWGTSFNDSPCRAQANRPAIQLAHAHVLHSADLRDHTLRAQRWSHIDYQVAASAIDIAQRAAVESPDLCW